MRKDIYERIQIMKKENTSFNYAELARRWDCDYRTIKKYFETDAVPKRKIRKPSKLDPFRSIIKEKVDDGCTAAAIYKFIVKRGYSGKYSILKVYVRNIKKEEIKKATIRFETSPGQQAQVDWKESLKMVSSDGKVFEINIFLVLLGYSRTKYLELTLDKNQDTVMKGLINSFKYFGGVPSQILFDNMKTVVDHSKSNYSMAVINDTFYEFSKDMGFEVLTCRPYRPQTKGKVEALAKLTSRLKPYNGEFKTIEELENIVKDVMYELNYEEKSLATNKIPKDLLTIEKEYLLPIPNQDLIDNYFTKPMTRIVSKESMITYLNNKYSLNPNYIGKEVELKINDDKLDILYKGQIIAKHNITNKKFNYDESHFKAILKSDAMKDADDESIDKVAKRNLKLYDKL